MTLFFKGDNLQYDTGIQRQRQQQPNSRVNLRFVNVKIIMPTRSVNILRAVPQLTTTNALAIFGGYLGIWLGLSLHSILRMTVLNIFKKIVRVADGIHLTLALACLGRSFLVVSFVLCACVCTMQSLHDLKFYFGYPGQVQHLQERMKSIRFPALSICVERGYNLTALCEAFPYMDCADQDGQRIIGAYLEETKRLLKFAYPRDRIIFDCDFISEDPACSSFSCVDAWEPSFTRYIDNVCWTFDVNREGKKLDHPLGKCPAPWKYYLKTSFSTSVQPLKERAFASGLLHEPGSTAASSRPTMRFRAGDRYRIAAFQSDSHSLPKPYESQCTDYDRLTSRSAYSSRQIQPDECAERCLMDKWFDACKCISKLYAMKHLLKAPMCDIFSHMHHRDEIETMETIMFANLLLALFATDIVSILEGHIGLWLGVSILEVVSSIIKYWTSFGRSLS
ncbi:uncharacterized protein LOC100898873 [Galendromus occidentalis]|uniref:Uncharacterized protein LOC100898873 n=1 Tax=Galendromus occidentalis TaxID=34638 RepID=A0AAJ7L6I2_9ACAR|nr:uncharacterized protein LOC100898873 [Galendromus occidentalis]